MQVQRNAELISRRPVFPQFVAAIGDRSEHAANYHVTLDSWRSTKQITGLQATLADDGRTFEQMESARKAA